MFGGSFSAIEMEHAQCKQNEVAIRHQSPLHIALCAFDGDCLCQTNSARLSNFQTVTIL